MGEPGGWDVVLEFLNDPDPALRGEAFAFAAKKTKGLETSTRRSARVMPTSARWRSTGWSRSTPPPRRRCSSAPCDDEDRDVRLAALESLVEADALPVTEAGGRQPPSPTSASARPRCRWPATATRRRWPPCWPWRRPPSPPRRSGRRTGASSRSRPWTALGELGDPAALRPADPAARQPARRDPQARRRGPWPGSRRRPARPPARRAPARRPGGEAITRPSAWPTPATPRSPARLLRRRRRSSGTGEKIAAALALARRAARTGSRRPPWTTNEKARTRALCSS